MNLRVVLGVLFLAAFGGLAYVLFELRDVREELARVEQDTAASLADIETRVGEQEGNLAELQATAGQPEVGTRVCTTDFQSGIYQLTTSTPLGPSAEQSEYDISHVTAMVSDWRVSAGIALGRFGLPLGFYVDYDGDGRIDTSVAVRLSREIPVVGNTLADKLLADSSTHQKIYSVFSCEVQNADFYSEDDMAGDISGTSAMLWELVEEYSASISEWISTVE